MTGRNVNVPRLTPPATMTEDRAALVGLDELIGRMRGQLNSSDADFSCKIIRNYCDQLETIADALAMQPPTDEQGRPMTYWGGKVEPMSVEDWEDLVATLLRDHAAKLAAKDETIAELTKARQNMANLADQWGEKLEAAEQRADAAMGLLRSGRYWRSHPHNCGWQSNRACTCGLEQHESVIDALAGGAAEANKAQSEGPK